MCKIISYQIIPATTTLDRKQPQNLEALADRLEATGSLTTSVILVSASKNKISTTIGSFHYFVQPNRGLMRACRPSGHNLANEGANVRDYHGIQLRRYFYDIN
jgi:membrane carboxypeptidase/penicillin-binding protein PbpC